MTSTALSSKAKGKQRATELESEPQAVYDYEPPSQAAPPKTLVIRFSEGVPDLTLQVEERDSVRDVKDQVRTSVLGQSYLALT